MKNIIKLLVKELTIHKRKQVRGVIMNYKNAYEEMKRLYDKLQQENQDLKEKIILLKASEPMLELEKYYGERDKYKEVIEEVREYIEDWLFDAGGNGASMTYEDINELLQILDKVKGE